MKAAEEKVKRRGKEPRSGLTELEKQIKCAIGILISIS